jgi:hypothetical protein
MTARDIEITVAEYFDYRRNLIVPNVYWGMGLNHEADILLLSKAGYATEIEIKVSRADLVRDASKHHGHESDIIKAFWFAVPAPLSVFALDFIPAEAGLLSVFERPRRGAPGYRREAKMERAPKLRQRSRKFTESEREQLARLAAMRYWDRRADPVESVMDRIAI